MVEKSKKPVVVSVSQQTSEQVSGGGLSSGLKCIETDELPIVGNQDDYYNSIKQDLLWRISDLFGPSCLDIMEEWFVKLGGLQLTNSQKELISELYPIIRYSNSLDTSKLKQFLAKNENNADLKAVLNLKVGAKEFTLLHMLIEVLEENMYNGRTLMEDFLKAGADPNIRDYQGNTPLHYAAAHLGLIDHRTVGLLIKNGADPNIQNHQGETFLHVAVPLARDYEMDDFMKYVDNFKIENKNGKTPMQIAIDNCNYYLIEHLFTEKQKKLNEELNKLVLGTYTSDDKYNSYKFDTQGIENLKKFLDKHKNTEDLKIVLISKNYEYNLPELQGDMCTELSKLLSVAATQSQAGADEQEAETTSHQTVNLPSKCLFNVCLPDKLNQLDEYLTEVSKAKNMAELQKVVNEAIISGVRLNFAKDQKNYFTDHVIERINQLKESPEVASNIVCILVSKGARLRKSDSVDKLEVIGSGFEAHKANMIKAYQEYLNFTQRFLKIAKNATNSELNSTKIDNSTFYLEYSEDSTIDVAKITDGARSLGLTQGEIEYGRNIIKIGKNEVEIITQGGIRNYTDLVEDSNIVLIFCTSLGELEVRLYPHKQNKDQIKVEVKNQGLLESLKHCKEELGRNCLLGGLSVNNAIEQGYFFRSGKLCQPSETLSVNSSLGDISLSSPIQESIQQVR